MIKVAICEPSGELANRIESLIAETAVFLPEAVQTEIYCSGHDFENALEQNEEFQLVYINMNMHDMDGITLGQKLRELFSSRETLLIYLSSYTGYSEQIFDLQPFLYLRIPFDEKDFTRKFLSVVEHLQRADDLFTCKKSGTVFQIRKKEIICLESIGHNINLSVSGKEDIQYRGVLKTEQDRLRTVNFIRPHLSFIVNLDYVEQFRSDSLLLCNQKLVPVSDLRIREVKQAVLKFWEYRNL